MAETYEWLKYNESIGGNTHQVIYPLTMNELEALVIYADDATLSFQALGFEVLKSTQVAGDSTRLGAVNPNADEETELYAVSSGYEAMVKVIVTNRSGTPTTYRLAHTVPIPE